MVWSSVSLQNSTRHPEQTGARQRYTAEGKTVGGPHFGMQVGLRGKLCQTRSKSRRPVAHTLARRLVAIFWHTRSKSRRLGGHTASHAVEVKTACGPHSGTAVGGHILAHAVEVKTVGGAHSSQGGRSQDGLGTTLWPDGWRGTFKRTRVKSRRLGGHALARRLGVHTLARRLGQHILATCFSL